MNENSGGVTSILLICREGASRQIYQAELDVPGVLLVCVQTLMQFFRREVYCPLNGILVDMPTYMRSSEEEKLMLTDLVMIFPALRIKCNESSGEIRTLAFGTAYPGNTGLAVFVQKFCAAFVQRKIRSSGRSQIHLPALLKTPHPVENFSGVRTTTSSMSCVGCFLIIFEPWAVGDVGLLTIPDLQDNAPIMVEVRSIRLWGEARSLPGMGVKFIDLSSSQKNELGYLGGKSFMLENL